MPFFFLLLSFLKPSYLSLKLADDDTNGFYFLLAFFLHFAQNLQEIARKGGKIRDFWRFSGTNRDGTGRHSVNLKTVCLYGHEGSNPPSSAKTRKHPSGCFFVLRKTILGDSNAVKKQHSALFLNGDRRFLQSINNGVLLFALQKSRAKSPILRQNGKAFTQVSAFLIAKLGFIGSLIS